MALLTLGNCRPDPRTPGKFIYSETYIHSKTMAVFGPNFTVMTGGSANIAFTSMWFHSEMNIAFMDPALIHNWVAQLWQEHLQISFDEAKALIEQPDDALTVFKAQADRNLAALNQGQQPEGRVYAWQDTDFPARQLAGIKLDEGYIQESKQGLMEVSETRPDMPQLESPAVEPQLSAMARSSIDWKRLDKSLGYPISS